MSITPWGADLKIDPENGFLVGPDKAHYPNSLQAFYYGRLGFCGCGDPGSELIFMRDVLTLLKERSDAADLRLPHDDYLDKCSALEKKFGGNDQYRMHYLYWLDSLGLTEHGSNISGSWLDGDGEAVLVLLQETDIEAAMAEQY